MLLVFVATVFHDFNVFIYLVKRSIKNNNLLCIMLKVASYYLITFFISCISTLHMAAVPVALKPERTKMLKSIFMFLY